MAGAGSAGKSFAGGRDMKIFVICPVRNADPEVTAAIAEAVAELEAEGHIVHWPARDTDQKDPIGNRICAVNCQAIEEADRVIIWWDPDSQGSLFDIGMAWALRKPLSLMNHVDFEPGKRSFAAMLNWWADGYAQAPLFAEVTA